MRPALAILMIFFAGPALAHIGHLGEVAGHGHWLGAAALGAAIALGLWQGKKRNSQDQARGKAAEDEGEALSDDEPQEA